MRTLALLLLVTLTCRAGESSDDMIPEAKFVLSAPASGLYGPWRDANNQTGWYAGELITITNTSFHYTTFSDVRGKRPDYSGTVSLFKDHIYLDHPGIPVLFTWEGYEQWEKTAKVFRLNVLYLQKPTHPKR